MFESVRIEEKQNFEAALIGIFQDKETSAEESPLFANPAVIAALARRECTGDVDNIVEAFTQQDGQELRVFIVGLGKKEAITPDRLRKMAAGVGRRLAKAKTESIRLDLAETLRKQNLNGEQCGRWFGEAIGLLAWNYTAFQGSGSKPKERTALSLQAEDSAFREGLDYGLNMAASVNLARDLSQTPPNVAVPLWMAEQAEKLAKETGLNCRVIQAEELEAERLNGLIHVGKGSVHPPCLIRLEYAPGSVSGKPPVVFLGKTITYDTGGLTLKINNGMVGMKRDKDGGCAVMGAMRAVATLLKPDFPVVGLLVAAENSVSDVSFRPDDVLTYRNGVTVEVTNTDAEGRLVLADGLCWACEVEKASLIVDLATLTGGVVTALGSTYAGLFCEEDALRANLEQASERSGERIWRLPMHSEYREMMKSPIADIINSNPNRKAHPIQGAAFLSYFVTEETPWAHIDIAGVHAVDADYGPFIKGPTGFGVRLLADLIASL